MRTNGLGVAHSVLSRAVGLVDVLGKWLLAVRWPWRVWLVEGVGWP